MLPAKLFIFIPGKLKNASEKVCVGVTVFGGADARVAQGGLCASVQRAAAVGGADAARRNGAPVLALRRGAAGQGALRHPPLQMHEPRSRARLHRGGGQQPAARVR